MMCSIVNFPNDNPVLFKDGVSLVGKKPKQVFSCMQLEGGS